MCSSLCIPVPTLPTETRPTSLSQCIPMRCQKDASHVDWKPTRWVCTEQLTTWLWQSVRMRLSSMRKTINNAIKASIQTRPRVILCSSSCRIITWPRVLNWPSSYRNVPVLRPVVRTKASSRPDSWCCVRHPCPAV